ncbi:ABC transporter permease [Paractinoplanes atraurantiacus]|uniref:ABC-2 type transport system permease protein n=1 Tax=Paractinoplanes atraurantiacus TaxID=1036182 RepID=A0A285FS36_9ACTN|nr:ABC transporter permease [Actinoplanes atraurantiacus]SNY13136.1 ABC-2 type transport system permease protein [Actinoplanes atraurantiacus]
MFETVRIGAARGRIELRQTLTTPLDLWGYLFPTLILLVVLFFMRDATIPGTDFSLGASTLPGMLGMNLAFGGLITIAQLLVVEREDGTLLRAKATPNGMSGYLVGKVIAVGGMTLVSVLAVLIPGALLVDGLETGPGTWLTLLWLLPLALLATMPIGAALGSIFESPRAFPVIMLPLFGLIAISGIFYPITAMPGWIQGVAQVFPLYWLGLGMRSAFLPDALAAVELTGSWRTLETFGVLVAWAVAGLALAPALLRRMARRESGSAVAARRERMMSTVGR